MGGLGKETHLISALGDVGIAHLESIVEVEVEGAAYAPALDVLDPKVEFIVVGKTSIHNQQTGSCMHHAEHGGRDKFKTLA